MVIPGLGSRLRLMYFAPSFSPMYNIGDNCPPGVKNARMVPACSVKERNVLSSSPTQRFAAVDLDFEFKLRQFSNPSRPSRATTFPAWSRSRNSRASNVDLLRRPHIIKAKSSSETTARAHFKVRMSLFSFETCLSSSAKSDIGLGSTLGSRASVSKLRM